MVELAMVDDAALRGAIRAARAMNVTAEHLALLNDAAQTILPAPGAVERWLVWFAWRDGSRRWQPGNEPYDNSNSLKAPTPSTKHRRLRQRLDSQPAVDHLPGAGPVAVATAATPNTGVTA